MSHKLYKKLEELRDFMKFRVKQPQVQAVIKPPKAVGAASIAPNTQNSNPAGPTKPGVVPPSKKDPSKVAAQLTSNKKPSASVENLSFNQGGQWTLNKADTATLKVP